MPLASLIETRTQSALNDKLPILNASGIIKRKNKKQYSTMDTSETGLEKIILDWLVQQNGYEQHLTVSGETHRQMKDATGIKHW